MQLEILFARRAVVARRHSTIEIDSTIEVDASTQHVEPDQLDSAESFGTETIEWLSTRPQYDPRVLLSPRHEQQKVAEEIAKRYASLKDEGLRGTHPSHDGIGKLVAGAGPDGEAIESSVHAITACTNAARKAFDVGFMRMNADLLGLVGPKLGADGSQTLDGVPEEFIAVVENVHIFPGIPELFEKKFHSIAERFSGVPFKLKKLYVRPAESDIAEVLNALLREFPELMLGSYPRINEEDYRVMLTLESRDESYVEKATATLVGNLPTDAIYKIE